MKNTLKEQFTEIIRSVRELNVDIVKDFFVLDPKDITHMINYYKGELQNASGETEKTELQNKIDLANSLLDRKLYMSTIMFDVAQPIIEEDGDNAPVGEETPIIDINSGQPVKEKEDKSQEETPADSEKKVHPWSKDFVVTKENIDDIKPIYKNARIIKLDDFIDLLDADLVKKTREAVTLTDLDNAIRDILQAEKSNWLVALNLWVECAKSGNVEGIKPKTVAKEENMFQRFFSNLWRKSQQSNKVQGPSAKVEKPSSAEEEAPATEETFPKDVIEPTLASVRVKVADLLREKKEADAFNYMSEILAGGKLLDDAGEKVGSYEMKDVEGLFADWKEQIAEQAKPKQPQRSARDLALEAFNRHYKDFAVTSFVTPKENEKEEQEAVNAFAAKSKALWKSEKPEEVMDADFLLRLFFGDFTVETEEKNDKGELKLHESYRKENWPKERIQEFRNWVIQGAEGDDWNAHWTTLENARKEAIKNKKNIFDKIITKGKEFAKSAEYSVKGITALIKDGLSAESLPYSLTDVTDIFHRIKDDPKTEDVKTDAEIANPPDENLKITSKDDVDKKVWEDTKDCKDPSEFHDKAIAWKKLDKMQDALICFLKLTEEGKMEGMKTEEEARKWFNEMIVPQTEEINTDTPSENPENETPEENTDGSETQTEPTETEDTPAEEGATPEVPAESEPVTPVETQPETSPETQEETPEETPETPDPNTEVQPETPADTPEEEVLPPGVKKMSDHTPAKEEAGSIEDNPGGEDEGTTAPAETPETTPETEPAAPETTPEETPETTPETPAETPAETPEEEGQTQPETTPETEPAVEPAPEIPAEESTDPPSSTEPVDKTPVTSEYAELQKSKNKTVWRGQVAKIIGNMKSIEEARKKIIEATRTSGARYCHKIAKQTDQQLLDMIGNVERNLDAYTKS